MDFSKIPGKIFFNGSFIKSRNAKIHVLNHSLHFASSVFEGIAVYNFKPLFIDDHYKRFVRSSRLMKLKLNLNQKSFEKICNRLIKINNIDFGYLRPILFRSSHSMSPDTNLCKTLISIAAWKWGKLFKKKGISLTVTKYPKLNKNIFPIEAKSSGSYQSSIISKIDAKKKGFDDCLMLDTKKFVAETSACNIFWIKKNIVYTPKENSILNGITRKCILEICKKEKIKTKIGNFNLAHILSADNVFATGTAAEIQLVSKLNLKKYSLKSNIIDLLNQKYEAIKFKCPAGINDVKKIV
jgi:branched-chain amino acid aminotransferase